MGHVESHDVRVLVDSFSRRKNSFPTNVSPGQRGFIALLKLVFVTERHLWPARQCQRELRPCSPQIQMQIAIQIKGWFREGPVIAAGIVVIPPPLLETRTNRS